MNYKIGICGAHGTGKTTLGKAISETLKLNFITNTMRSMWQEFGITDFEKLPADARSLFQKHAITRQIKFEEEQNQAGFITDRTVLDNLGYTLLNSDMFGADLEVYKLLVQERLKNYTHLIYLPVVFDSPSEHLRADISTRITWADIIEGLIEDYFPSQKLLRMSSVDHNDRIQEVLKFIDF
jgi:deoxyadenosine/deoxycytidine kinase